MGDFDKKFIFVAGKGGVGKTTVAVALCAHLARTGRRVLLGLNESGAAARLAALEHFDGTLQRSPHGFQVVLIHPEAALREYASLVLHSKTISAALFDSPRSRSFFSAIPGLYQWAVLGKAWFHAQEQEAGRDRFDTVVFDAPATGHGLEMLRVPKMIAEVAPKGILRRDAALAWQLFTDERKSGTLAVTLPEELAVSECLELVEETRALGVSVLGVVLNARRPQRLSSQQAAELAELRGKVPEETNGLLTLLQSRFEREQSEAEQAARLESGTGVSLLQLPWSSDAARGELSEPLIQGFSTHREGLPVS